MTDETRRLTHAQEGIKLLEDAINQRPRDNQKVVLLLKYYLPEIKRELSALAPELRSEGREPVPMQVDADARWLEIQAISNDIAYRDEPPTPLESALCGAVVRARDAIAKHDALLAAHAGLKRERDNLLGINAAWARDYAGEKERGDKWMTDCKEAERKLQEREGYVSVPRDVLVKVDDALQRALDDRAPRRIPVDAADADILQVEIRKLLTAAPPAPNRDAERLDWLDRNYHYIDMSEDGKYYRWQFSTPMDNRASSPVRDRIDAALAAAPEREGKA